MVENQINFVQLKNLLHRIEDKLEAIQDLEALRVKEYLNHAEAMRYLGVSKQTMYLLRTSGEIPFYQHTKRMIYYKKSDLNEWMLQNMVDSQPDPQDLTKLIGSQPDPQDLTNH